MKTVNPQQLGARVAQRRAALGMTQDDLAGAIGMKQQGIDSIEAGRVKRPRLLRELARTLQTAEDWLLWGEGPQEAGIDPATQNARLGAMAAFDAMIPVYGHAAGGKDGEFPLNGNRIGEIPAPSPLRGVRDAYAVYVVGNSMEPRYFSGEAVFVNPRLPVRRGDFVVAQIAGDEGSAPLAYVKRFAAKEIRSIRLEQFNPRKVLVFPAQKVVSVHRIVMGGEG